jgi:5'-nucleotidase
VAAALEGVVLGIPAVAVSQQAVRGEMGWHFGGELDFKAAAAFTANLVTALDDVPLPEGTLLNVNVPAGHVAGARVCRLGKRIYRDRLQLQEDEGARRRFRIYGDDPSYHEEDGTDFAAIAEGEIAITPVHFDLTDRAGMEALAKFDMSALLGAVSTEDEASRTAAPS